MITAERKPLDEILELVGDKKKILVAGCDTCVAICLTGGEKEAEILASELRIMAEKDGREVEVEHTAAIRQCEWEYLDLLGDHVEVLPLALADGRGVLDLDLAAVLLGHDAQLAGQDLGLFLATGEADGDAGVAACDQDLLLVADELQDLVEGFAFGGDHSACPSSAVAAAVDSASSGMATPPSASRAAACGLTPSRFTGLGPSCLMRSVNSVATSAPMAEDMLYISTRSGSMPSSSSNVFTWSTRLRAHRLPLR